VPLQIETSTHLDQIVTFDSQLLVLESVLTSINQPLSFGSSKFIQVAVSNFEFQAP
jgi:hypothetical protein